MNKKLSLRILKRVLAILLVLGAAGTGIYFMFQPAGISGTAAAPTVVAIGQPAPDFTLPNLNGKLVSLHDNKGKIIFLNFWATWCVPCRKEMPSMEKLYQALKGEPFEILAVSIDSYGADVVAPFMADYQLSFPALLDTDGTVRRRYNVNNIPQTFIIDKEGVIVSKFIGSHDWSDEKEIQHFRDLVQRPTRSAN